MGRARQNSAVVARLRILSGLILALYVLIHLINHSLGLLSIAAMESMRKLVHPFWSNPLALSLLYGSLVLHFLLALWSLYQRHNLRLAGWEATQLTLGLLTVPLIAVHAVSTRGAFELFGIEPNYERVVTALWSNPAQSFRQVLATLVIWGHFVVGIHFWLRVKSGYPRALPYLYPAAILLPLLALLGFLRSGLSIGTRMADDPTWIDTQFEPFRLLGDKERAFLGDLDTRIVGVFVALLLVTLLAREARRLLRKRFASYRLTYGDTRSFVAHSGTTMLEGIRAAGISHASVCGGRGRCTTCRVRVVSGLELLDVPNETESVALSKINAPADVRLACQVRPKSDVQVVPLLPATTTARTARRIGGVEGHEQQVAILFLDLRHSTALAERLLPYDVVYLLNQFFAEMSAGLSATNGHYAQFNGDGLMALYGLDTDLRTACQQSIHGAAEMMRRLDGLNRVVRQDVGETLRMGIGIHSGEAIVGRMGPPQSPIVSAIGDNVNVAARLESLSKTFDCGLVVSQVTVERSGLDLSNCPIREASLKGRRESIPVYTVQDSTQLIGIFTAAESLA